MLTNSVSTLKSPLQFRLNTEVILTSCSKNVVMSQFMKNSATLRSAAFLSLGVDSHIQGH